MLGHSTNLDISSPSKSYQDVHGDLDQYLDCSLSETHSSVTSPYDTAFAGDHTGTSSYPSPGSRDADDGSESPRETSAATESQPKPAAKRRRENRYKNAPPSVLSRRRAQNRASQRAYRERKDQRIKDLELMLDETRARNDVLSQAYAELQVEYVELKASSSHHPPPPAPPHVDGRGHPSHRLPASYSNIPAAPGLSASAGVGAGFFDPASMGVLGASNDLGAYLYPVVGVGGYPL